jgi:hypothetical protein
VGGVGWSGFDSRKKKADFMTKQKAAFLLSVERLFSERGNRRVYMWTFTFRDLVGDDEAFRRFNHLRTLIVRGFAGVGGLRVVEVHPGTDDRPSHGLHFHVLLNRRCGWSVMERLAIRAGFGRIHWRRVSKEDAAYMAKYLSKEQPDLGRRRRFAALGNFDSCRVRDVVVEGALPEMVRALVQAFGFSPGVYAAAASLVADGFDAASVLGWRREKFLTVLRRFESVGA